MAADNRKSAYAITVYPESTDIEKVKLWLSAKHLKAAISPLHNADVYNEIDVMLWQQRAEKNELSPEEMTPPVVGQFKKPHYHIVIAFGRQKKSIIQMRDICKDFAPNVRWFEPIVDLYAYTRYLCHLDDPDKASYSIDDVVTFAGFDTAPFYTITKMQMRSAVDYCCGICRNYGVYLYCDLVDIVIELNNAALFDAVKDNAFFFKGYMDGLYQKATGKLQGVNPKFIAECLANGDVLAKDIQGLQEVA